MPETFTAESWKSRIAAWWRDVAPDLPGAMARLGVRTSYGLLAASAWLPLLEVYGQQPGPAVATLVGLVSGVGTNLVANVVQGAYEKANAANKVEEEVEANPDLRAEFQQVLGALDVLALAQAALGEQWATFRAQLDRELAAQHMTLTINSAGGPVIMGNLTVGGDFTGHDRIEVSGDAYFGVPVDGAKPTELLQAYYRHLAAECARLPLGVVDPRFVKPGSSGEVPLHVVYVGLDVVAPVRAEEESAKVWGLRLSRGEGDSRVSLLEALSAPEAARVVLLGDPGSGKTTFVDYLTHRLADATARGQTDAALPEPLRDLWPVRLVLREVAIFLPPDATCGTAAMLWDAIAADMQARLGEAAAARLMPWFQARLLRQGGLFLLDGLDEVPEAGRRRRCLLEAVSALVSSLPSRARVILTARPYAYADPIWHLPGFPPPLALAPFSERQVDTFVDRWYHAVRPAMGWNAATADGYRQRLVDALKRQSYLADLASRPLLLTLMTTLHTSWGQLPEDRADLYEESVKLLLARWQRGREVIGPDGKSIVEPGIVRALAVGEAVIRSALEKLAYTTHARQGRDPELVEAARYEESADIPQADVLGVFTPLVPEDVNPAVMLKYLETRAGLLLGRREGVYAFLHRSFQEYLAACYLANTAKEFAEELARFVIDDPAWWREVFLLGVGKKRQGGLGDAVNVVNTLVPVEPGDDRDAIPECAWRVAAIAAEALVELRIPDSLEGRPHFKIVLDHVRTWLEALVDGGHLAPRDRWRAGDLLGSLGDTRPGVQSVVWVEIPAGPFLMGSRDDEADTYDDEKPQHTLDLPQYYISRFPVTNAQFQPFVEGDGYTNRDYWTPSGWAWREGAEADLSPLEGLAEDTVKAYREWLAGRPKEWRDRPYYWEHPEWGAPNRPVVGVTWYEAMAYCKWLEKQLKVSGSKLHVWHSETRYATSNLQLETFNVQLPSEAEWEKAARSAEGRRFPWGEWEENCANTEEAGLGQTSAVGLFPRGASSYGVLDMVGNVWEWTRSRWGRYLRKLDFEYPYVVGDEREAEESKAVPVLRGGSWIDFRRDARCAFRYGFVPDYFFDYVGFRVMLSLGDSGC
jgi:formylglycine-generating enzyme required for sulfatase activity